MMPTRVGKIKNTGAMVFLHSCEDCGKEAYFGINVSLRKALNLLEAGKFQEAKQLLGKWYCREHHEKIDNTDM